MQYLPIFKEANDLVLKVEKAVKRFHHYYKHTLETELVSNLNLYNINNKSHS